MQLHRRHRNHDDILIRLVLRRPRPIPIIDVDTDGPVNDPIRVAIVVMVIGATTVATHPILMITRQDGQRNIVAHEVRTPEIGLGLVVDRDPDRNRIRESRDTKYFAYTIYFNLEVFIQFLNSLP